MDTNSIAATASNPASTKTGKSTQSLGKLAENFDDFLQLLIVQLRNQDPTSPLDTNQFTQQIVEFTNVEQQINTNKNLEQLISLNKAAQTSYAASFIGKDVEAEGNLITYDGANQVSVAYNLENEPKKSFITIRDIDGNVVFSGEGSNNKGRNNVTWNGIDNDGNKVEAGIYDVSLSIQGEEGNVESHPLLVRGKVFGVDLSDADPQVIVNGEKLPLDKVKFVGALTGT